MQFLKQWMAQEPNHILFFYGPKSSGKTTLIYRFVEGLLRDDSRISVKLFNLREILIVNYDDFLQRFFTVEDSRDETSSQIRQYDLKVFKLTVQTEQKLRDRRLDPFDVMKAELKELYVKGIRSVIIIDELQALDFIYFNGQRELIKELLNFFVAMTKERHLCHVLLSSSDGYFIEKLYNDSKLRKTSDLYEVDYLPKEDIVYWLNHLGKDMLLGHLLKVCQDGKVASHEMEKIVERYILQAKSYFEEYVGLKEQRKLLLKTIHENMTKGFFKEADLHLPTILPCISPPESRRRSWHGSRAPDTGEKC